MIATNTAMLGSSAFIFPDTGDHFIRTLKLTTLYCESVTAMTVLSPYSKEQLAEAVARLKANQSLGAAVKPTPDRIATYLEFWATHGEELALLRRRSARMTHFCSPKVTHTENTLCHRARQICHRGTLDIIHAAGVPSALDYSLIEVGLAVRGA